MGNSIVRWGILPGVGLLILAGCAVTGQGGESVDSGRQYRSSGEQIYFTGTSQRGTTITSGMGMGMMNGGMNTCASCHGPDGRGGRVRMMMRTFTAPDIRYETLVGEEEMAHEHEEEEHPPYTNETIKRAITQGVNPAGEPLEWPMPRWTMSEEDLVDLLDYLKGLP